MAAALVFLVSQLFLFGSASAQCNVTCSPCKEFSGGDYNGTWNLKAVVDPACPHSCLYQRNSDAKEMCFCDPGPIKYDRCPEWLGCQCYNNTAQPKLYDYCTELFDNSVENCRSHCIEQNNNYTYIGLEQLLTEDGSSTDSWLGSICCCGNIEPPTPLHPLVNSSNCDAPCPGNPNETCGAYNYINVCAVVPYTPVVTTPASGRR